MSDPSTGAIEMGIDKPLLPDLEIDTAVFTPKTGVKNRVPPCGPANGSLIVRRIRRGVSQKRPRPTADSSSSIDAAAFVLSRSTAEKSLGHNCMFRFQDKSSEIPLWCRHEPPAIMTLWMLSSRQWLASVRAAMTPVGVIAAPRKQPPAEDQKHRTKEF